MCVVSMVTDHYRERWTIPPMPEFFEKQPLLPIFPMPITITQEQWREYQELKRKAAEYDRRYNEPDCVKPDVLEWENSIKAHFGLQDEPA